MSNQAGKVPDTTVVIAGDVWPVLKEWAKLNNLVLREITTGDEAEGVFLRLERYIRNDDDAR